MTPPPMPPEFPEAAAKCGMDFREQYTEELWQAAMSCLPPITTASLLALPGGVETAQRIAYDAFITGFRYGGTAQFERTSSEQEAQSYVERKFAPRTTKRVRAWVELAGCRIWWNGEQYVSQFIHKLGVEFYADACHVCFYLIPNTEQRDNLYPTILALKTAPLVDVPLDHWAGEVGE